MSYCTQDDLLQAFGEKELLDLTNKDEAADTINTTVLAQCMTDADAEIDGYLQGRCTLPLPVVPLLLRNLACDIVRYRLYDDRVPERVQDAYDDAIAFLTGVSTGKFSLGLDSNQQPAVTSGGAAYASSDRKFTSDTLKDYRCQ